VHAYTTNHWDCLWPHLLQQWSLMPLCSRVHRAEEECHSMPPYSPNTWSVEGGHCKDRSCQLHHRGGYPEGEQVLVGTFSLNGYPVVILFDSAATHDFISRACTQNHQLDIQHSDSPYMISTPRGRVATKHFVRRNPSRPNCNLILNYDGSSR
jgi:hypothetical protein